MWLSIKIKRTDISTNPLFDHLVGTTGFEPAAFSSQN